LILVALWGVTATVGVRDVNQSTQESLAKMQVYASDGSLAVKAQARSWSPAPFLVVVDYSHGADSPMSRGSFNGSAWRVWYLWVFGRYRYLNVGMPS
jgi:hypothetical protein